MQAVGQGVLCYIDFESLWYSYMTVAAPPFLFILFLFSFFLFPLFYCLPSSSSSLSSSSFSFHPSPLLFSCHHHLFLYIPLLLLCLLTLLSVKVNKGFSCPTSLPTFVATCFLHNRKCCWRGISSRFQLYFPAKRKSCILLKNIYLAEYLFWKQPDQFLSTFVDRMT